MHQPDSCPRHRRPRLRPHHWPHHWGRRRRHRPGRRLCIGLGRVGYGRAVVHITADPVSVGIIGRVIGAGVAGIAQAVASASVWVGLATAGQLSTSPQTPSASASLAASLGQVSQKLNRCIGIYIVIATRTDINVTADPSPSASLAASSGIAEIGNRICIGIYIVIATRTDIDVAANSVAVSIVGRIIGAGVAEIRDGIAVGINIVIVAGADIV